MLKVSTLISFLEDKYPTKLSFDWDNCGLQIGSNHNEVHKVLLCLTLTSKVLDYAIQSNVDYIITHHPLFFKPISQIDTSKYLGKTIKLLINNNISVYCLHTNFDVSQNGVSDVLAEKYGITKTKVLSPSAVDLYKLIVYVPKDQLAQFRSELLELRVGSIGNYSHCSFCSNGEGTFLPEEGSNPCVGQKGTLEKLEESRIEVIVKEVDIDKVVSKMKDIHSYEEPAYDIVPLRNKDKNIGLGRYTAIKEEKCISDFLSVYSGQLKGNLDINKKVKRIAFSGGSGASLVGKVVSLGIDLFITGDIDYHTAIEAEEQGLTILDIGHEQSEMPAMHYLKLILADKFPEIEFLI
ncbi:MAG: Nif3-like dinuclear metal center hexameric protein [Candidatus Riflemargulisbacteria bacterium]